MSTTDNTSYIDKKKEETTEKKEENIGSDIGNFFKSILSAVIFIIIYFVLGGLALYYCKLAQSNILPTDTNCFPYEDNKPDIQSIFSNIFTTFTDPPQSMKINFPYDKENMKNTILEFLNTYKNSYNSGSLSNYFIGIIEGLISMNYSALNIFYNLLNQTPEFIIILFGPILAPFYFSFLFFFNNIYVIFLWFYKMSWFFKRNVNTNENSKPKWEYVTLMDPLNYGIAIWLVILFIVLFFVLFFMLPILPSLSIMWCLFSSLGYKGVMNNKSVSCMSIVKDVFKYYKVTLMSITSFFVISSAFSNLGTVPGIFSILTLCLIYYGIISMNIFNSIPQENLSDLVSNAQAKKKCSTKTVSSSIRNFITDIFYPSKGGGKQLLNEIKKISKNFDKK